MCARGSISPAAGGAAASSLTNSKPAGVARQDDLVEILHSIFSGQLNFTLISPENKAPPRLNTKRRRLRECATKRERERACALCRRKCTVSVLRRGKFNVLEYRGQITSPLALCNASAYARDLAIFGECRRRRY
jgi:hypothetical protein